MVRRVREANLRHAVCIINFTHPFYDYTLSIYLFAFDLPILPKTIWKCAPLIPLKLRRLHPHPQRSPLQSPRLRPQIQHMYARFTSKFHISHFTLTNLVSPLTTGFPGPSTDPSQGFDTLATTRLEMLKSIIGHVGDDNIFIEPPFNIDYGCNISLGDRFYANFNLTILDCSLVTIGKRCMFGPNVSIFAATHETEVQSRRENIEYGRPVVVGDDCWIGGNVVSFSRDRGMVEADDDDRLFYRV
jgi:hypothetical protein